ncbi:HsdM family class I SAM-dependent methyltransferase [Leptospira koniambonensis]|uniref:HsdM family class I SAM-dependent methyltransferase n=1 Tax=Leptospira koniambonensis TaxID=2484950 RepID=UPI003EBD86E4
MKNTFKYLSQYSAFPKDVDRLVVSAFLEINKIKPRKNKLLKSYLISKNKRTEYLSLLEFISIIKTDATKLDLEMLVELFEFVISPADKIINGAIYTPNHIRDFIVKKAFSQAIELNTDVKISDIACGCGGFLLNSSRELKKRFNRPYAEIFENNIFGLDIQKYSIMRTKLLLSLLAFQSGEDEEEFSFNLFHGNSLNFDWRTKVNQFSGFNIIMGNPPYVCARNLDQSTREELKNWEVSKSGNSDLYIPFFQIAIELLTANGLLGYITMNSFFKSLNGRALRDYFQRKQLSIRIIDFGAEQVFKSKNTYTCICFIENRNGQFISYTTSKIKNLRKKQSFNKIAYKGLNSKKGWNLNDNRTISKIESTGIPFGELYRTRHGIATLKNDIFIFKPIDEDDKYFYLQNGSLYKIEKEICKDIVNSNRLSREISLKEIKEKLIFPYDQQERPKLLSEKLIKDAYPEAHKYLQSKKRTLAKRDKGNGKYENWFAFGRTQSLEKIKNKMFFPKYSDKTPNFIINSDENLLFYNGLAIIGCSLNEFKIIKKIMESNIFWYYIKSTSKPYTSNYYSLNGNYLNHFGICELSSNERKFLLKESDQKILNKFFEDKYEIMLK